MHSNILNHSSVRVAVVEDRLANLLSLDSDDDQAVLKALLLLALRRIENFVRENTQEIEIFAPNEEDEFLGKRCMKPPPSRATLERALSLMKHLDQFPTGFGSTTIDEVFLAVLNIARYFAVRARW